MSLSLFGLSLLQFAFSTSYDGNYMDIRTFDIKLPIPTYAGIGGIFEDKLYMHSGFNCTQSNCSHTTQSTLFLLDLQSYITSTSLLSNLNNANWTQIDYDYLDSSDSPVHFGISTSSVSTQIGQYSYAMYAGSNSVNVMLKYDLSEHQYIDASNYKSSIPSNTRSDTCIINDGNTYLYSIGGRKSEKSVSDQVYRYDTLNDAWQILTSLNVERFAASCVMDSTKRNIYVLGGNNGNNCLSSIEMYDTQTDIWTLLTTNLIQERYQHVSVLHPDDWIVSIGGIDDQDRAVPVEIFDPNTLYTVTTDMMYDRTQFYHAMHVYPTGNIVFLYGGMNNDGYYDDIQYIVLSPTVLSSPTSTLTLKPTSTLTLKPTSLPTYMPSITPTLNPTSTLTTSIHPTETPVPTSLPSITPTILPTTVPSTIPTVSPTLSTMITVLQTSNTTTILPANTLSINTSHLPIFLPSNASHTTSVTQNASSNSTVSPSQYTTIDSMDTDNNSAEILSSVSYATSMWRLITHPSNITWSIIVVLILLLCCCGFCLCYFILRSRKYHREANALKMDKSRHIHFPATVPSKSMDASTYTNKSGHYDIDTYLNGCLASSPSSYLSSTHNRSYNSNAMTRRSPIYNQRSPSANRQIGYKINIQHISIPIDIDNISDNDGEESLPPIRPKLQNSTSDDRTNASNDVQSGKHRSWTEWKQKQQQMMSYRNQMQWQLQRPRAQSYQQYQYQPYVQNYPYNGYYAQRNPPPPPPIQLQQEKVAAKGVQNVPPPPPYDKGRTDDTEEDEVDSVTSSDASSSAHSHTYGDKKQDEDILSDHEYKISPIQRIFVGDSNNSLEEQKAQELDLSPDGTQLNSENTEKTGNKFIKHRERQMKVFEASPEIKEMMGLNDKEINEEYRFEPGASNESHMSVDTVCELKDTSNWTISSFKEKSASFGDESVKL